VNDYTVTRSVPGWVAWNEEADRKAAAEVAARQAKLAHTCGGPVFGRKTPGCPRCDQLSNGAAPVTWGPSRRAQDAQRSREVRAHFTSPRHMSGACGPVCTFGEW
jgi:hypothetical protein